MVRLAIFFALLFALAFGLAWMADNPGSVTLDWPWLSRFLTGEETPQAVTVPLHLAIIALAVFFFAVLAIVWVVSAVLRSPRSFGRWRAGRKRDKGYDALSRGLVAAGAGNAPLARRLASDAHKQLGDAPLVSMLEAQTALLEDDREQARLRFRDMLERDETRLLGLRGLYLEAEREGAGDAAAHFAREANEIAPGTPWAARAVLKSEALAGDWESALRTLETNRASGLLEKDDYNRQRAVLLTALAREEEPASPDQARSHAVSAHKLDPSLVPAATTAAAVCVRLGDMRKAAKVLEETWKEAPHPDVAQAYVHLRAGDSVQDRLKRARTLKGKKPDDPESQLAVASAAIDAEAWDEAREALSRVLRDRPTERACLMMADLEEAQHGDMGRVREWLSRAVHAPRDPVWTADGVVSEEWQAVSPVTGAIGAFQWKQPTETLALGALGHDGEAGGRTVDGDELARLALAPPPAGGAKKEDAPSAPVRPDPGDDVEDAQVIEVTPSPKGRTDAEPAGDRVAEARVEPSTGARADTPLAPPPVPASQPAKHQAAPAGLGAVGGAAVASMATSPSETAGGDEMAASGETRNAGDDGRMTGAPAPAQGRDHRTPAMSVLPRRRGGGEDEDGGSSPATEAAPSAGEAEAPREPDASDGVPAVPPAASNDDAPRPQERTAAASTGTSPYRTKQGAMDPDGDGMLDRRPDDPGPNGEEGEGGRRKGYFF